MTFDIGPVVPGLGRWAPAAAVFVLSADPGSGMDLLQAMVDQGFKEG